MDEYADLSGLTEIELHRARMSERCWWFGLFWPSTTWVLVACVENRLISIPSGVFLLIPLLLWGPMSGIGLFILAAWLEIRCDTLWAGMRLVAKSFLQSLMLIPAQFFVCWFVEVVYFELIH